MCHGFFSLLLLLPTQDFERDVGLAQADGVQRGADLASVLPSIRLGHPLQRHCGRVDGRPALKGT